MWRSGRGASSSRTSTCGLAATSCSACSRLAATSRVRSSVTTVTTSPGCTARQVRTALRAPAAYSGLSGTPVRGSTSGRSFCSDETILYIYHNGVPSGAETHVLQPWEERPSRASSGTPSPCVWAGRPAAAAPRCPRGMVAGGGRPGLTRERRDRRRGAEGLFLPHIALWGPGVPLRIGEDQIGHRLDDPRK